MLMILALAGQFVETALAADAHDARSRWPVVEKAVAADAYDDRSRPHRCRNFPS